MRKFDVIIIGAGAAGLMCAHIAGKRGRSVLLLDHAKKPAEKIRISGGGRCNFTNHYSSPSAFISNNPHFCKSIFSRYTQTDFIELVRSHKIDFHEKKLGQLFCDNSAQDIIKMLLDECDRANVILQLETHIKTIEASGIGYKVSVKAMDAVEAIECESLVIATGGLSIPKIGASRFGYDIAQQFGLNVTSLKPALVPLTFHSEFLDRCRALSGVSVDAEISFGTICFREGLLFTHRGLSGPSVLQISSYWDADCEITINLSPELDLLDFLKNCKSESPKQSIHTALSQHLPKRLAEDILGELGLAGRLADLSHAKLQNLSERIHKWLVIPNGTEGYRTAEVTCGGVDVDSISAKTMQSKSQEGLYFIGEVIDVTGHLGGYNFQWAWSSGFVAGQNV